MNDQYVLIREGMVLVRIPGDAAEEELAEKVELFDVKTGVQLRGIIPHFKPEELRRAVELPEDLGLSIVSAGAPLGVDNTLDLSKVVSILEVKQRRLDSVVADSILDQLRLITSILKDFLDTADHLGREQRFWMSQQVLTLIRKFSGRELEELQEIVRWIRSKKDK